MMRLLSRSGRLRNGLSSGVGAADHDMIAPAGARVLAVDHELVGAEPGEARLLVDRLGGRDAFAPVRRGMDVDLDDARVGRDANDIEARIGRGRVALDLHRHPDLFGRSLGGRDQFEIVLEPLDGGRKTHRAPSRDSTVTAVRTAPSMSPSRCSTRSWADPSAAANDAIRCARSRAS